MVRAHASFLVFASLLSSAARAQEPAAKPDPAAKLALLHKAVEKMAALQSCAFAAKPVGSRSGAGQGQVAWVVAQPAAPAALPPVGAPGGGAGGGAPAPRAVMAPAGALAIAPQAATAAAGAAVSGAWADGLLWAGSGDGTGAGDYVWRGRRMIARQGQDAWRLRQGVGADGQAVPRSFDPEAFFPALATAKLELLRSEVGSLEDRPVEVLTLHASGDDAHELLMSGLLPDAPRVTSLRPRPEVDLDVAVWLDPASARICQVKVRCTSKGSDGFAAGWAVGARAGAAPAPVLFRPAPAAVPAPEAPEKAQEQPEEPRAKAELAIKNGLPERKATDGQVLVVTGWDVTFTSHDAAKVPDLDAKARALLGIPSPK